MPVFTNGGYHPTFGYRTQTSFDDPIARRTGYTEPRLTLIQHAAVMVGASLTASCAGRPINNLERFYFLSDVPGESNRVFLSDKRAEFFRVLFSTHWWGGRRSIALSTAEYTYSLALFAGIRNALHSSLSISNTSSGFLAGALSGVAYAFTCHPYDVLRATADMQRGHRTFKGPMDVLVTALKEKPAILLGVYKGVGVAVSGRALQYGAQFGIYNALRYDGVYRHSLVLFAYCHAATVVGTLLLYPCLSLKQQLHVSNSHVRGSRITYRALIAQLRRRHGITKIYDGFFTSKPLLHAVPPALMMTLYDIFSRRYTEYLHPELTAAPSPSQSILWVQAPDYVAEAPQYEFATSSAPAFSNSRRS